MKKYYVFVDGDNNILHYPETSCPVIFSSKKMANEIKKETPGFFWNFKLVPCNIKLI